MRSLSLGASIAVLGLAGLASAGAAACVSAASTEVGGDPRFDASPPENTFDAAISCGDPDAGPEAGHAFTDLYRDFFGPTGKASCAGTGQCHGDATQPGAIASGQYVCGPDQAGCYSGMVTAKLVHPGDTTSKPESTDLYAVLRKCSGGGTMPKQPATLVFSGADLTRIRGWLSEGAPND